MPSSVSTFQKTGYLHKKEEIDYAVARRITKLYKILEHRFQSDVKVWLSHIDFLKRMVSEPLCEPMLDLQPIPQYMSIVQ